MGWAIGLIYYYFFFFQPTIKNLPTSKAKKPGELTDLQSQRCWPFFEHHNRSIWVNFEECGRPWSVEFETNQRQEMRIKNFEKFKWIKLGRVLRTGNGQLNLKRSSINNYTLYNIDTICIVSPLVILLKLKLLVKIVKKKSFWISSIV